jgi:O-antigen/teichoic acid export membrane protein
METTETTPGRRSEVPANPPSAVVARNAFNLVLGQAATTAVAILLSAVLGRSLGAHGYGVYFLITTFSTFAYVFVEWGQPLLVIRCVATEPLRSGELLGTSLVLRTVLAVVVTIPAGLAAWALGYDRETIWLSVLLILGTLPFFLAQGYGMIFRGHDQMGRDAAVSVLNKCLSLALIVPALALGTGLAGVIIAQAAAGLVALALAAILYRQRKFPALRVSRKAIREILSGGFSILSMTGAISTQPYLDAVLLSKLAPTQAVGWFGAARNILGTLMAPATILGSASYPRLARTAGESDAAVRREVAAALRTMLWLGALVGTGTFLFANVAVALIYGSSAFGPAAVILEVFAPGMFLLFIDILLSYVVYACGKGKIFAIGKIASVFVSTALNLVFIPVFQARTGNGGIGVLVSFAASEVVVFAGALMALPRRTLGMASLLDVGRAILAGAGTALLFHFAPPITPFLAIPLCVLTFAVASVALGLIRRRDLATLQAVIRSPRGQPTV